ncbi:hypothetical protein ARMGADRAFT_925059 [Armillaria gallica]|uniref:Uncharacterized protein n=1 Tax=Armillaria gallica TaxID=47427 RepID=A0A2H3DLV1_ARMGA|nr:hypothetical protein ARMGADRAFT_925059 [Armillaria gallica]
MGTLNNCHSHQSYYTALSLTVTAAGTLIHITDNQHKKIQGGCSGFLWQKFRELELLDNITTQQYHGLMPITIMGDT